MLSLLTGSLWGQRANTYLFSQEEVETEAMATHLQAVLGRELQASLDAIGEPEQMPAYLFGEPTGGGFSATGLPLALARYRLLTGATQLGPHDLRTWIDTRMQRAVGEGGTTFAQLGVAEVLQYEAEGKSLLRTPWWQVQNQTYQDALRAFLQTRRSYDPDRTETWTNADIGGRPNNYYGVALWLSVRATQLGLDAETALTDSLFARCLGLLEADGGWLDDSKNGRGAFDRYHFEFIRFVYEAAGEAGRRDVQARLRPWVKASGRLWWDLVDPVTGLAVHYGRSRMNAWGDAAELAAFFASHPDLAPAPPEQVAVVFVRAWNHFFTAQYDTTRHLVRMLDFGRGTNGYAGRDRIWGYSIGTLGKMARAGHILLTALRQRGIPSFPVLMDKGNVSRYQAFRAGNPQFGVYVLSEGPFLHTVIPLAGQGFSSEYLPVPYNLPGIELPVAVEGPLLTPWLTLANGTLLGLTEGAGTVSPHAEGLGLGWTQWHDAKGQAHDPGLRAEVDWTFQPQAGLLRYSLTLRSEAAIEGAKLAWWLPVAADSWDPGRGTFFFGPYRYELKTSGDLLPAYPVVEATGNGDLGKGARQPVPFLLRYETDFSMPAGASRTFSFTWRWRS
ncbi:MAG: hypothetical protein D6722_06325 [Bacteroidetes bacterium]|nr:MAG: hypothetical protein D6722_06325 [Bacteroidota bacterium]